MFSLTIAQVSQILNQFGIPFFGTVDSSISLDTSDSLADVNYTAQLAATVASLGNNKTPGWAAANLATSETALATGSVMFYVDYQKYKNDEANHASSLVLNQDLGTVIADGGTVIGDLAATAGAIVSQFSPKVGETISGIGNLMIVGGVAANHTADVSDFFSLAKSAIAEGRLQDFLNPDQQQALSNASAFVQGAWSSASAKLNSTIDAFSQLLNGRDTSSVDTDLAALNNWFGAANDSLGSLFAATGTTTQTVNETETGNSFSVVSNGQNIGGMSVNFIGNPAGSTMGLIGTNPDGSGLIFAGGSSINFAAGTAPTVSVDNDDNISLSHISSSTTGFQGIVWNPTSGDVSLNIAGLSGASSTLDIGALPSGGALNIGNSSLFTVNDGTGQALTTIQTNTDGGYTQKITNTDNVAATTYNGFGQPISGRVDYTAGGHSETTYSTDPASSWQSQTQAFDGSNNVIGTVIVNRDGTGLLERIDPITHEVILTADVDQGQIVNRPSSSAAQTDYPQFVQAVADTLATQLISQVLIKNNLPASIATQAFADAVIKSAITPEKADFPSDFASSVFDIAGGIVGSDAGRLVAKALGVPQEIGTLAGGVTGNLLAQAAAKELGIVQNSGDTLTAANFAAGLAGAAGSFAGSELASLVLPTNLPGAITGAVASAATLAISGLLDSAFILANPVTAALEIFAVAFGSDFLGTVVGDLFGGLFGGQPSVGPNATAQDEYNYFTNTFGLTTSSADNGGDVTIAQNLVKAEAADENMILQAIGGKLVGTVPADSLGYFKGKYFYAPGIQAPQDFPNTFTDAEATVDFGALATLRSVQLAGGNLLMSYMLYKSDATTLQAMLSDLTAARDYSLYASNPMAFNLSLALSGNASQYAAWQTELARIHALGLDTITVLGSTKNLYGTGGVDVYIRTATGQLSISEFNSSGQQVAGGLISNTDGTPLMVDPAATVLNGVGQNLFGTAGHDFFLRNPNGQVVTYALNSQNQATAGSNVEILGTGWYFYASATGVLGHDIYYRNPSNGQLVINEYNDQGQQIAGGPITYADGSPVVVPSGSFRAGVSSGFYNNSTSLGTVFIQRPDGTQLILDISNQNKVIAGGSATILGTALNFYGTGGKDVFYNLNGQLAIAEFDTLGGGMAGGPITFPGGAPVGILDGTTIVGLGRNLFGTEGRDLFLHRPDGQDVILELNDQNQWIAGGNVTILGTASNLYGMGGNDIFYRTQSGQLLIAEFDPNGHQLAGGPIAFASGSPVVIDSTATIVGIGHNIFGTGGGDVIVRQASGQGVILEISNEILCVASAPVTINGDGSWTYTDSNAAGGDAINAGSRNEVIISGNGQFGNSDLITISAGTVALLDNARADIYGANNAVTIGQNDLLGVQNGSNNAITAGIGSNIYVNSGTGDTVTATGGGVTIFAAANVSLGLVGGNNGVVAAIGDMVNVSGNGQFGASDYVTISNGIVNVADDARADIYGAGNSIVAGQNDLIGIQNGDSNTLTLGSGTQLYLNSGNGDTVNATGGDVTIFASDLVSFGVVGGNNTVFAGNSDTVNVSGNGQFGDSDYLNISNGTVNVAANARADIYGGSDHVTAGANTLIGVQNGNNNTVTLGSNSQVYVNSGTGDTLNGGGNDQYFIAPTFGQDTINNGTGTAANGSVIFGSGITDEKLWFKQSGNDLIVQQLGTTDQIDIAGWFTGAGKQVQAFDAGGLQLDTQVALLVQAMASYATGHTGFNPTTATTMPTDTTLQNAIVAAWHS